jgi:glycine cleavage system H protein
MNPQDAKYTQTHEWARPAGGADVVTVGITEFAVHELGDLVYVELPAVGAKVSAGKPFGVIESAKAAVDLNCPVTGQVAEANASITEDFESLTGDPYGKGWMIKVKLANPSEMGSLMSAAQYETFIAGQPKH